MDEHNIHNGRMTNILKFWDKHYIIYVTHWKIEIKNFKKKEEKKTPKWDIFIINDKNHHLNGKIIPNYNAELIRE